MLMQHILSSIFANEIGSFNNTFNQVKSNTVSIPLSGYVHLLDQGNAIFISDEHEPYLITLEFTLYFHLKTGDRLQVRATHNAGNNHNIVTEIVHVQHVAYDDAPVIKAEHSLDLCGTTINLGTSLLLPVTGNTDIATKTARIHRALPHDIVQILLSFDGRPTNFDIPTAYFTKPNYSSREKLMTCLLAFFHAKQQADTGKDVVLIIDSLDKMFFIFNSCMQTVATFDPNLLSTAAIMDYENILCCSGNLKAGGSLTIIGLHHAGNSLQQLHITDRLHQIMDQIIDIK